jgi:hypothetical protein
MMMKLLNRLRRIRLPKPTPPPEITPKMKMNGLVWARIPGRWIPVCDFCGGNCGQCGNTEIVGNVGFSMQRIAEKSGLFDKPIYSYRQLEQRISDLERATRSPFKRA